ncbi:MAG: ParB N-terminal domain-containing protein [Ignavibacteria bacterium]|nr:ParB N-terminal domain-containing protein [Ignavibacteria bacterium]
MKNKEARVWEPHRKSLNQVFNEIIASDILNKNSKHILVQAKNFEKWESQLYRIVLFYKLIKYSFEVDPILINSDYEVIDGYHRIVAYKLANEKTVKCKIIN